MLNIATSIHSLSDFKRNDPDVTKTLETTGGPVVLTVNGKAKYVVQDAAGYQQLLEAAEEVKTLRAILELKAGKARPAEEFFAEFEKELKAKPKKKK
ncbi:MAG TPA: type II toxin-antitoxin system Phd/YefM family antitoxin [Blastocatellia bacterium]|nr:type II toxin-antitoxin system Phd/YefM family antitoxin [Blastocatellia bacterium]